MVKVIDQSFEIITEIDGIKSLKSIEIAARTCYKSEDKISEDGESAKKMVKMLIRREHTAMLEFGQNIHVILICNRGLTHEMVRHRLGSYAQESTRYCDYSKDKHGHEITVIRPILNDQLSVMVRTAIISVWYDAMVDAEMAYINMRDEGANPQIARGVLPIDVKTEINVKANPREWRHILKLRTNEAAHPQIRAMMREILAELQNKIPVLFDDL